MMNSSDIQAQLETFEFVPGRKAPVQALVRLLPDIETALFFAKALNMPYSNLEALLVKLFKTSVVRALFDGKTEHSSELQDYIVGIVPDHIKAQGTVLYADHGVKHTELLPAMWEAIELGIAKSISEVVTKLSNVIDMLPSKEGSMTFQHLQKMNKQRPTIGVYAAGIRHGLVPDNLVILDVSGSMTEATIAAIVGDVVALSWKANAHLAIVSDNTFYWEPGTYQVSDVLSKAEYNGTHYETLAPLLNRDWGTVITIADYDSSASAARHIASNCKGRIGQVLDLSLVDSSTYLAEVVGQLADSVQPLLIAANGTRFCG